jgi:glycosyltransferase involved in cell wall biosynthesis
LSKVIIESLAIGQPVLCSNVLPMKNYIINNENGFLTDNSAENWSKAILQLSLNRDLLKEVSNNSRLFIKENYVASSNILDYEIKFKSLL